MALHTSNPLLVDPLPPVHSEELLHVGSGLLFIDSPTEYLKNLRQQHGDTFLVDIFGFNLLVTFSAKGLESLYQLEEKDASFGFATYDMIRFKTPTSLLMHTDPKIFYTLLMNKKMPQYVEIMSRVIDMEFDRWGEGGTIEVFDAIRTLEQRVGYGLWICEEAALDPNWQQLKACFDVLDQATAFVNPADTLETIRTGKAREKQAAKDLYDLIPTIISEHDANPDKKYASADFFKEYFSGQENFEEKLFNNTINANQGFLSNLYAAIAWVVVRLAEDQSVLDKVRKEISKAAEDFGESFYLSVEALDAMEYLEQVMMESVRVAQRSLTLRKVLKPVDFDDGKQSYRVQPDVYITTMSSVTNTQLPTLASFNPDNYAKNRLVADVGAAGKESISTFGHGKHACPAQRFSHHMCKIVVIKLLRRFDIAADFEEPPKPSKSQMGGVSRSEQPAYILLDRAAPA